MDKSELATRCKAIESARDDRAPRGQPLLVRLDGRAFHTYTSGLRRPAYYSHRQLLNKNTRDKIAMLRDKGVDWSAYPDFFRVGCFLRRRTVERVLTAEEQAAIPEKHRPPIGAMVTRSAVMAETPPTRLTWEWLLRGD